MMKMLGYGLQPLWLAGCLLVVGCSKKEEPAPQTVPAAPATPVVRDSAPPPSPPAAPTGAPAGTTQTASPTDAAPGTASAPEPSQEPAAPPPPPPTPAGEVLAEDPKNREWTAGVVKLPRPTLQPVTLRSVRTARNEGFDRVVFEFDGPQVPGYFIEYTDKPAVKCGSGDTTEVAGQGWLEVRLTPAQAHEGGQVTVAERERKPKLPVLQELELTCDFEADVTWVLGTARPNKYRVMELREPTRLVVDVQH